MTKKDYILIADLIVAILQSDNISGPINELCFILKRDNPNFNQKTFVDYIENKLNKHIGSSLYSGGP